MGVKEAYTRINEEWKYYLNETPVSDLYHEGRLYGILMVLRDVLNIIEDECPEVKEVEDGR